MGDQLEGQWVVPNPQVPRAFGIMNVVFGILLLLMGAGYLAFYVVMMPTFQKQMVARVKEELEVQKKNRQTKIAELKKKEAAAKAKEDAAKSKEDAEKPKEEKADIVEERVALENDVEPDVSGMTDLMGWNMLSDVRLAVYYFSEIVSGMVLNVLLVISGAGLLGLAEWGRRLALGVAWLKIARWVAMLIVSLILIVPISIEKTNKVLQQVQAQAAAKSGGRSVAPIAGLGQVIAIMTAVAVVFSALVGSIYPAISLWFLTRPSTRAACLQRSGSVEPRQMPDFGEPA